MSPVIRKNKHAVNIVLNKDGDYRVNMSQKIGQETQNFFKVKVSYKLFILLSVDLGEKENLLYLVSLVIKVLLKALSYGEDTFLEVKENIENSLGFV